MADAVKRVVFDGSTVGKTYELESEHITTGELLKLIEDTTYLETTKVELTLQQAMYQFYFIFHL